MAETSPSDSRVVEKLSLKGVELRLETGSLARQADGAVVVRSGRSLLLATVVSAPKPRPGMGFFPLTVEYRERIAAAGRVPGSRIRREGRITDREILTSRLIDRTLRPLFPKGYRCDTQVIVTVYSADADSDLESLGLIGASAALHLSNVPFRGPVAGLRVCRHDGQLVFAPASRVRGAAEIELMVSASRDGIVMVEGRAEVVPEAEILEALDAAESAIGKLLDGFDRLRAAAGRPRRPFVADKLAEPLLAAVRRQAEASLRAGFGLADKQARRASLSEARRAAVAELSGDDGHDEVDISEAFEVVQAEVMRKRTLAGERIGGRAHDAVRAIAVEVGALPSNHGSAVFTRGETQALVSATLGGDRDALDLESLEAERRPERFILHYNFPPFSVGESRPMRGPGRREIGHGNLARTALLPVLPGDEFPYVVRVVSDILESNGSSSMATVCGASLALMDAGVPIAAPVAGIAMGLVKEGERTAILSDILGDEDHFGDMDFKVAGTAEGVTAVQLDNKLGSLPRDLLSRALTQARTGRLHILEAMGRGLSEPRPEVAAHAPQVRQLRINPDRIGALIGSGGKTIKGIQESTSSRISIDDDGTVRVMASDRAGLQRAVRAVEQISLELRNGGLYLAEVVSVKDFGAFVQIGDHEGLVHVSALAKERVESVERVVSVGDSILVRVVGVDDRGKLRLSRAAALGHDPSEALNA